MLGRHGVLDGALAARLAKAVGLRNVLVHQYAEVDDDRVVGFLDRLGDIDQFVAAVSSWLDAHLGRRRPEAAPAPGRGTAPPS